MIKNNLKAGMIIGMFAIFGTFTINAQSNQKQQSKIPPSVD